MIRQLIFLDCGSLCPFGKKWVNGEGAVWSRGYLPCLCLLLVTNKGLVLIDAGLGAADISEPRRRLGWLNSKLLNPSLRLEDTAKAQIRRLGFQAEDVRDIICTHLDLDHIGGASDFPWARVHVSQLEFQAMTANRRYRPAQLAQIRNWVQHPVFGDDWFGFKGASPLIDGLDDLVLVPLPGHSAGHIGVAVRWHEGWFFHVGDAIFHHNELDQPAEVPRAIRAAARFTADNWRIYQDNQERLRALKQAHNVEILCSHHSKQALPRIISNR